MMRKITISCIVLSISVLKKVGALKFTHSELCTSDNFQANAPDTNKIPLQDAVGVTVVLLTCGYKGQEFIRVGYYVNNEYMDQDLKENQPTTPDFSKVRLTRAQLC